MRRLGALRLATWTQLCLALALAPLVLVPDLVTVPHTPTFHGWAWLTIVGNVVAVVLLNRAIQVSDLSYALPFLALTPPLVLLGSLLPGSDAVSLAGGLGVGVATLGGLTLGAQSLADGLRGGGLRVLRDPGVRAVLAVAAIYAITATADQRATRASDPWTFLWYSALSRGAIFAAVLPWLRRLAGPAPLPGIRRREALLLALLVATQAGELLAHLAALVDGPVAYVVTLKRLSVLLTSLAAFLLFRERFTPWRLLGAGLLVAGAALVTLG